MSRPLLWMTYSRLCSRPTSKRMQSHLSAPPAADGTRHEPRHDKQFRLKTDQTHFEKHLNTLFKPLQFPPELARRILTHGSHKAAAEGHNARLSFMGRRVLETYLLLFLQSSPSVNSGHDYDLITSQTISTHVLGKHVGQSWDIGRVLRWTPPLPSKQINQITQKLTSWSKPDKWRLEEDEDSGDAIREEWLDVKALGPELPRSVGLYKVLGEAVQATVGGIFHQFGGSVAHRVFHTRLLPLVLLPGTSDGLPDAFHKDALLASERMGGETGPLMPRPGPSTQQPVVEQQGPTEDSKIS